MSNSAMMELFDPQTAALEDLPVPELGQGLATGPAPKEFIERLPRPAWIEIDLEQLERNFRLIRRELPDGVGLLSVIKDDAYGHGAVAVAKTALRCGVRCFGLSTLEEGVALRERGIQSPMLLLGDRHESELPWCISHDLTCCVSEPATVKRLARLAEGAGEQVAVQIKINTGMNRYGVHWTKADALAAQICSTRSLVFQGVLSHFAQSDESDKTFAMMQLQRFQEALQHIESKKIPALVRHLCNSGGFLDLPCAHFDMVRMGILPLGVYPSSVCRRIPGILPVMTVKARVASIQHLQPGDTVGYGMRYKAESPRRIGVLPIGYGDGFPRVRNQGFALVQGKRVPIVGGVAMDALTVDLTDVPAAALWDEAVLMGRQGQDEISVHEVAKLKGSVSYDVLTGWRGRLPRIYLHGSGLS